MRKVYTISALAALAVAGLLAQSDSEYQGWMKSNQMTMASLNKNIMAKDGSAAAADAKTLQGNFKNIAGFWQGRSTADAVEFANKGAAAAGDVAQAAAAGDFDKAAASVKTMQGSCGGCHMAHRERTPEGAFKIK